MLKRLRFKNTTLEELLAEAQRPQEDVQGVPPGSERDRLFRKTRQAKAASHLQKWLISPGPRPPT
jgi:hypothetical protein